jgi:hypothetical protein
MAALDLGLAAARRARELLPGGFSPAREGLGLTARSEVAQEQGDLAGALAYADQALALGSEAAGRGGQPMLGTSIQARALIARAHVKAITGGDPHADYRSAWDALDRTRRRQPEASRQVTDLLDLANDWFTVALVEGRFELPLEEAEALGRAQMAADPSDVVVASMTGSLRMVRGVAAHRAGQGAKGDQLYREGERDARRPLDGPIDQPVRRGLVECAVEKSWASRAAADVAEAERLSKEYLRRYPGDGEARRFPAAVLLLRAELAPGDARAPLLAEALLEVQAAAAGATATPHLLALRGRIEEALQPGRGAEALEQARRGNPRLYLLRGP